MTCSQFLLNFFYVQSVPRHSVLYSQLLLHILRREVSFYCHFVMDMNACCCWKCWSSECRARAGQRGIMSLGVVSCCNSLLVWDATLLSYTVCCCVGCDGWRPAKRHRTTCTCNSPRLRDPLVIHISAGASAVGIGPRTINSRSSPFRAD